LEYERIKTLSETSLLYKGYEFVTGTRFPIIPPDEDEIVHYYDDEDEDEDEEDYSEYLTGYLSAEYECSLPGCCESKLRVDFKATEIERIDCATKVNNIKHSKPPHFVSS